MTPPIINSDVQQDQAPLAAEQENRTCPFCGESNTVETIRQNDYNCPNCRKEMAHLDYAPNGTVRGIFGWLLTVGDVVLERYQIKSVLGKGGFGAAYLVDDLQLGGKHKALKEVPDSMFDEYETSLLSRLDHPAIPYVIERKSANGMVYLALKFGGSRTLGEECQQYPNQRIPLDILLPWMRQLCEVLEYLHTQTPPIIHRDLKPDNLLLDENGRIMLIDFGIAKEAVAETMTRLLARAATLYFSPPEQVMMGGDTDEHSDIYSLGSTFYALLTGQNPPAAHERIAGKELTQPGQLVPNVPPEIDSAIIKALELNKNNRQSVKQFAAALEQPGSAPPLQPPPNKVQAAPTVPMNRADHKPAPIPNRHQAAVPIPDLIPYEPPVRQPTNNHRIAANDKPEKPDKPSIRIMPWVAVTVAIVVAGYFLFAYWQKNQAPQPSDKPQVAQSHKVLSPTQASLPVTTPTQPAKPLPKPADEPSSRNSSLDIEMVPIPPGTFWMGANDNGHGGSDEMPNHKVKIHGFKLGKTEVTQGQWKALMDSNPSNFQRCGDDCPVEMVSLSDVQEFIRKLNAQMHTTYRLPTEAEWEYACRAGGNFVYCGSDDPGEVTSWQVHSYDHSNTNPVKEKKANAWGIYGMSGNVEEWTCSAYTTSYGTDSELACATDSSQRVARGGSSGDELEGVRSSNRHAVDASLRSRFLGFRLAQD